VSADARSYLVQQLSRFRLAAKEMRTQLDDIDRKLKEVQADLILVIAALDGIEEEESRRNVA
jgi:hypothetical protein